MKSRCWGGAMDSSTTWPTWLTVKKYIEKMPYGTVAQISACAPGHEEK
jgi:hypothetical protein